jgi:hypothetical protein
MFGSDLQLKLRAHLVRIFTIDREGAYVGQLEFFARSSHHEFPESVGLILLDRSVERMYRRFPPFWSVSITKNI